MFYIYSIPVIASSLEFKAEAIPPETHDLGLGE
jgi:hypothetical protein